MSLNVRKGDNVLIIAGKDKGKTGKVLQAYPQDGKVRVENVNIVYKHKKARSAQDTGGIMKQEGKLDVSNVQIICPECNKATRVGHMEANGKKVRKCIKCGASLDVKTDAKKAKKEPKARRAKKTAEDK